MIVVWSFSTRMMWTFEADDLHSDISAYKGCMSGVSRVLFKVILLMRKIFLAHIAHV